MHLTPKICTTRVHVASISECVPRYSEAGSAGNRQFVKSLFFVLMGESYGVIGVLHPSNSRNKNSVGQIFWLLVC